jgi:galactitol-specific phosphotransferase system IIB component
MKKVVKTTTNDKGFTTEVQGVLSIAGTSKTVNLLVAGTETTTGFEFVGEKALKMTAFNIDPPTALFGTLKTGDDITIKFKTTFKKN